MKNRLDFKECVSTNIHDAYFWWYLTFSTWGFLSTDPIIGSWRRNANTIGKKSLVEERRSIRMDSLESIKCFPYPNKFSMPKISTSIPIIVHRQNNKEIPTKKQMEPRSLLLWLKKPSVRWVPMVSGMPAMNKIFVGIAKYDAEKAALASGIKIRSIQMITYIANGQ